MRRLTINGDDFGLTHGINRAVFADATDARYTYEICMYQDNKAIRDSQFLAGRKTLNVREFSASVRDAI